MKLNCWEFMQCGRGPRADGENSSETCPAALEERLDGIHGGENAGRSCWVVAGTLCGGKPEGSFARKVPTCAACAFYRSVQEEEFPHFTLTPNLLAMLCEEESAPQAS